MEIISRVDGQIIKIEFDESIRYGIMMSGGLDSSVLLYCLAKESADTGKKLDLQVFSVDTEDGPRMYVNGIIDFVNKKFGTSFGETIYIGDPNVHHSQKSIPMFQDLKDHYPERTSIFMGSNTNPPDFNYERDFAGGYPNRVKAGTVRNPLPFIHLYKTHIVDLMFQVGAEELANITHTCTERPRGRCNFCFQCRERDWAFTKTSNIDTGEV